MDTTMIIMTAVIAIGGSAAIGLYYYRKRNSEKLYGQVFEQAKQVPKNKRKNFLLLMFRDSLTANKKGKSQSLATYSNPKYVEAQLLLMAKTLKDPSKVKDKHLKRAIALLNDFNKWERKRLEEKK